MDHGICEVGECDNTAYRYWPSKHFTCTQHSKWVWVAQIIHWRAAHKLRVILWMVSKIYGKIFEQKAKGGRA